MKFNQKLLIFIFLSVCLLSRVPAFSMIIATRAYVSNQDDNSISVIDTASNNVIQTINLVGGSSPTGIAVTPDDAKVIVVDKNLNNVFVFDIATNTLTSTIEVGNAPQWVAVTPDGKNAYVTNSGSNTISVIDILTCTVVDTIPVGNNPYEVAVTPDGTKVLATNFFDGTVSVISVATNRVVHTISVGVGPILVAITPDGKKAYVSNNGSTNVSVIDIATNQVIDTVGVGLNPFGIAITPDGRRVFVGNNTSNTVSIIDTTTNQVVRTIELPEEAFPNYVVVNPDGTEVYVVDNNNNNVTVIDITTENETPQKNINVGNSPIALAFIPLPLPPMNLEGKRVVDKFFNYTDYINRLTWIPSKDPLVKKYELKRNGKIIAEFDTKGPFTYDDHKRHKRKKDTYELTAVNKVGIHSPALLLLMH